MLLVVGGDHVPRVRHCRGVAEHFLDGALVLRPARPVAQVLRRQLPALEGVIEARAEALELLLRGDVEKNLNQADAVVGEQPLEVVDLGVGAAPLRFAGEALDALHQDPAIPRAVEHHQLPGVGQAAPEAVQVGMPPLLGTGRSDRPHLEAARIERPPQAADDAALAGGVPALEHYRRPPLVCPVGERDLLQVLLQPAKPGLVLPVPDARGHVQPHQAGRLPLQPVRRPLADSPSRFSCHSGTPHSCAPKPPRPATAVGWAIPLALGLILSTPARHPGAAGERARRQRGEEWRT